MIINKIEENKNLILIPEGRLDAITSTQLQDALIPAFDTAKEVKLDFSKIEYISSAGLRVLLIGQKAANSKGASMLLCSVSEEIMEVLKMTGFTDMLTIV